MSIASEKLSLWRERVETQKKSGKSAASWCRENNLPVNTFLYWKGKLDKPFRELVDEDPLSGIYISLDGKIEIRRGFDILSLQEVIKSLKTCA